MNLPEVIKIPNIDYRVGCDVFSYHNGNKVIVFCVGHGENDQFQIEHMGTFKPETKEEYDIWIKAMSKFFDCKLIIENR